MNFIEPLLRYGPPGLACICLVLSFRLLRSSLKLPSATEMKPFLREVRIFMIVTVVFMLITTWVGFSNSKEISFFMRPKSLSSVSSQPEILLNQIPLVVSNGMTKMVIQSNATLMLDFEAIEKAFAELTSYNAALLNESASKAKRAGDSFVP